MYHMCNLNRLFSQESELMEKVALKNLNLQNGKSDRRLVYKQLTIEKGMLIAMIYVS